MSRPPLLGALFAALAAGGPQVAQEPLVHRVAWLAGCWELSSPGRTVEEQWMAPRGGTMVGMSRTVVGGVTRDYEFLRVREEAGRLAYVALPAGQAEVTFLSTVLTDSAVVFANSEHDFPQRIAYRRLADGSLAARIEGTVRGEERAVDFLFRPASCP